MKKILFVSMLITVSFALMSFKNIENKEIATSNNSKDLFSWGLKTFTECSTSGTTSSKATWSTAMRTWTSTDGIKNEEIKILEKY